MRKLLIFFAVLLLVGCRTITQVEERVHDVYHNTTDTLRDSVYYKVFVDKYVKGDTVFLTQTEYKYKLKYQSKTDTLLKTDTIYVTKTIEKKAETDSSSRNLIIGLVAMSVLVGILLWQLYKSKF